MIYKFKFYTLKLNLVNYSKNKFKEIWYSGRKYHCPFCGHWSRKLALTGIDSPATEKFKIVGAGLRAGACIKCKSKDRERLVYIYLTNVLEILDLKSAHILHIAPERNIKAFFKQNGFENYISGDKFCAGYIYDADVMELDVTNLAFDDNLFDIVICNHVLEHVEDDIKAMSEINRVLKPGGKAILQVPIAYQLKVTYEDKNIVSESDRHIHFGQKDHVRVYGIDYFERLEKCGFKTETLDLYSTNPKFGLNKNERVIVCEKIVKE